MAARVRTLILGAATGWHQDLSTYGWFRSCTSHRRRQGLSQGLSRVRCDARRYSHALPRSIPHKRVSRARSSSHLVRGRSTASSGEHRHAVQTAAFGLSVSRKNSLYSLHILRTAPRYSTVYTSHARSHDSRHRSRVTPRAQQRARAVQSVRFHALTRAPCPRSRSPFCAQSSAAQA